MVRYPVSEIYESVEAPAEPHEFNAELLIDSVGDFECIPQQSEEASMLSSRTQLI